jgi:hypothetical protein
MQAPTVFDYSAFISELTALVDQAKAFDAADRHYDRRATWSASRCRSSGSQP